MLRGDALATLYFFHPLRRLAPSRKLRIPILMYHSISDSDESSIHPYYRTSTSPAVFAQHMKFLHDNNYQVVGPSEAVALMGASELGGAQPVVITFDDGFENFYTQAFPILNQYGFGAIMYLPTAHIGPVQQQFNGKQCMSWSQVRELRAAGIEFGSHTVTHPQLKFLDDAAVEDEVRTSKEVIEQELGCTVTSFAYPYAFPETDRAFTHRLASTLEGAGYENGVSTIIGTADRNGDRYFMKRLPVNACDDIRLFRAKLEGGYAWVHTAQYASKLMKHKH
jgi:peptidoglycan/xylan/chitin deacetylase (PgdA/CDA1 family)